MTEECSKAIIELYKSAEWSLAHFRHMDEANSSIHTASVKFSPITFRLARAVYDMSCYNILMSFPPPLDNSIALVLSHDGAYELDKGR